MLSFGKHYIIINILYNQPTYKDEIKFFGKLY